MAQNQHDYTHSGPKTIDGFRPVSRVPRSAAAQVKAKSLHAKPIARNAAPRPVSHGAHAPHHVKSHPVQRAQTLMRSAVKKPAHPLKRHAHTQVRTDILAKVPEHTLTPKQSWHQIDARREQLAHKVAQNKLVSRFGGTPAVLPPHADAAVIKPTSPGYSPSRPVADIKPTHPIHHDQHSKDIFEHALARATSHTQKAPSRHEVRKKKSLGHKIVSVSAALAALVLIAGFVLYENSATLTMKVAANKAGFGAHMPGYQPSGFAVSKFTYSPGAVAVAFKSTSDSRAYQLTQRTTTWDAQALLNEYVSDASTSHQSFETAGLTIYTYGKDNATWVNNGVWYNVVSNGGLSDRQLLDVAQSL